MEQNFHHPIRAGHIKDAAQEHILLADEATRADLAARFGLPGIALLRGVFVLRHERGGIIAASLRMQAKVTQTCVVTLSLLTSASTRTASCDSSPRKACPSPKVLSWTPKPSKARTKSPIQASFWTSARPWPNN